MMRLATRRVDASSSAAVRAAANGVVFDDAADSIERWLLVSRMARQVPGAVGYVVAGVHRMR